VSESRHVAGIILAAGAATRMGRPKQLLDWGGQPLVAVAAEQALAAGLAPLLVVVGAAADDVTTALGGLPVQSVPCAEYASGQSASLRAGIAALGAEVAAVVVLLADQPFVTAAIVEALVTEWRASGAAIVAPVYRGVRGNPVLFDRAVWGELLAVTGDKGAREVIAADAGRVRTVAFDDDRPLADIDTPAEYERLRRTFISPKGM
jgi:molybdenum cofactor cytidylyltransferase